MPVDLDSLQQCINFAVIYIEKEKEFWPERQGFFFFLRF